MLIVGYSFRIRSEGRLILPLPTKAFGEYRPFIECVGCSERMESATNGLVKKFIFLHKLGRPPKRTC